MKTLILALALALASTAASADGFGTDTFRDTLVVVPYSVSDPLSFSAYAEYAVEVQEFELGLNANYRVDAFTFGAGAAFAGTSNNFDFDRANLSAAYSFTDYSAAYISVNFNDTLEYDDVVIGVVARF